MLEIWFDFSFVARDELIQMTNSNDHFSASKLNCDYLNRNKPRQDKSNIMGLRPASA
jgi:hypothetical protein